MFAISGETVAPYRVPSVPPGLLPGLEDTCLEPFLGQAKHLLVSNPVLAKRLTSCSGREIAARSRP